MSKNYRTKFCLACRNLAESVGGHVHPSVRQRGVDGAYTAGWCPKHGAGKAPEREKNARRNCPGCFGQWLKKDGRLEDEP